VSALLCRRGPFEGRGPAAAGLEALLHAWPNGTTTAQRSKKKMPTFLLRALYMERVSSVAALTPQTCVAFGCWTSHEGQMSARSPHVTFGVVLTVF
jgi:hypothetical protein